MRTVVYVERGGKVDQWRGDLPFIPVGARIRSANYPVARVTDSWIDLKGELPEQVVIAR